ncbi:MAG: polyphenol oxidase family protein [Elusimicrobiales bacterium]|jgi:hypothetical protein
MLTEEINGLKLLRFENLAREAGLKHAVSTRHGGVSPEPYASLNLGFGTRDLAENSLENLTLFCEALGVSVEKTVRMRQAHTANVCVIGPEFEFSDSPPSLATCCDALVTNLKETPLLALSADCGLTVFYDPVRSALAVGHSGWRGALLNLYSQIVSVMKLRFGTDPGDLIAGVSPMISAENYPVKDDLIEKFKLFYPEEVVRKGLILKDGRHHFSLKDLLKYQLHALGVKNYEFAHLCTCANKELFYSWRRDGEHTGRFGLLAELTE